MLNNRTRGIGLNKNAANIQPVALNQENQPAPQYNHDNLKRQLRSDTNTQDQLNPIKRLGQLSFSKFNTIFSDENASQPPLGRLQPSAGLKQLDENPPKAQSKPLAPAQFHLSQQSTKQASSLNVANNKPTSSIVINLPKPSLIPVPTDKLGEIEDIDKSTSRDAMYLVCDIAKDIYDYMYQLEIDQAIKEDFLKDQKIFTPKVRHRLVNWCIFIHQSLKLLPETLYMTVSLIDRYFSSVQAKQQHVVQLVACGAILIASKYEEIYPPDVGDLIHLTQNAYSRSDIFKIEINILETLNFNLGKPIAPLFLRRFSKANQSDLKTHSIAKYLMELSLSEYECSHWNPSLLAAAALYVSIHLIHQDISPPGTLTRRFGHALSTIPSSVDRWNRTLVHYSHYNKRQLQEPAAILCKILKRSQKSPLTYTVVKKYQANLQKWTELKSPRIDQLIKSGSN